MNSSSLLVTYTDNLSATASFNVGVFDNAFTQDVELYIDTTTTNGVQFKDIDSSTGAYITFLKIAPNGGTNPPLEFKRGMQVTGSVTISGSAVNDLTVIGNQIITGSLLLSSSVGLPFSNTNGTIQQYFGNTFGGNIGIFQISNSTEIGLALDGAAWTTNWGNGPILYVNNTPGDTYEGVFGFQNKTNYTDGRITALKPLDVRGNTTITGSLILSSSNAVELNVIGNSVFTGSVDVSGAITASIPTGFFLVGGAGNRTRNASTGSFATVFGNTFNGNQTITGSVDVSGSVKQTFNAPGTDSEVSLINVNGAVVTGTPFNNVRMYVQDYPGFGQGYQDAIGFEYWDSLSYLYGSEMLMNGKEINLLVLPTGSANNGQFRILDNGASKAISDWNATEIYIGTSLSRSTDFIRMGNTGLDYIRLTSQKNEITGSTIISGSSGLLLIGNQTITGSLILSSSAATELQVIGGTEITGSFGVLGSTFVSGSVRGNVAIPSISSNTASLDFGSANFFEVTLVSGALDTHIVAQNVRPGQTINLKVSQPGVGTGTISFPSTFKFPEVAPYTASLLSNSVDVVTFITFEDTGSIYSVAVKGLV